MKYNETIKYTITARNTGNAQGTVTIKDTIPTNTELVGSITLSVNEKQIGTISKEQLEEGYLLTLNGNETAKIEFTVKVIGYAGEETSNTAKYKTDDEFKDTDTVKTKIEDNIKVISSSKNTTSTSVSTEQNVILVLDASGSMNDPVSNKNRTTKLGAMKTAVNAFLDKFLQNGKNKVMIITYSENARVKLDFTSDLQSAKKAVNSIRASLGTNTDAGLTMANSKITAENAENTSVIVMADGLPCYYIDENGVWREQGDGSYYAEKPAKEAKEISDIIKNKGSKIYSIGFGLDSIQTNGYIQLEDGRYVEGNSRAKAKELMKYLASSPKEQHYFDSYNEEKLNKAFEDIVESITTVVDGDPIDLETNLGKAIIKNTDNNTIFEKDAKVEIYVGEYKKDKSTAYKTYTLQEFINLESDKTKTKLVVYDETNGQITFDLGTYLKENDDLTANSEIIIRFINNKTSSNSNDDVALNSLEDYNLNATGDNVVCREIPNLLEIVNERNSKNSGNTINVVEENNKKEENNNDTKNNAQNDIINKGDNTEKNENNTVVDDKEISSDDRNNDKKNDEEEIVEDEKQNEKEENTEKDTIKKEEKNEQTNNDVIKDEDKTENNVADKNEINNNQDNNTSELITEPQDNLNIENIVNE